MPARICWGLLSWSGNVVRACGCAPAGVRSRTTGLAVSRRGHSCPQHLPEQLLLVPCLCRVLGPVGRSALLAEGLCGCNVHLQVWGPAAAPKAETWHLPEGLCRGKSTVQPFGHLCMAAAASAAVPACLPCGGCFASLRLSGWLGGFCTLCSFGRLSLVCVFKCRLCFTKGALFSMNGIIHFNIWSSVYARKI